MNLLDVRSRVANRLLLSIPEAGEIFFGLGRSQAYESARRGELPTCRAGRRRMVPVGRVAEILGIDPAYLFDTPGANGANPQVNAGAGAEDRPDFSPTSHADPEKPVRTDTEEG